LFEDSETLESVREKFEKKLAEYIGTKYAIACSSGRSALRFSLLALDIKQGDEIVIPDYTAEIIPITVFCNGAVPKFCDIDPSTLSISPEQLKKVVSPKTKAVILVHLYGLPVDPSPILEICQAKDIFLIDDAAQALGASINGKKAGSFGNTGIISFNKFLNVKVGGAILTNDEEIAEKIKVIREKCEIKSIITRLGYRFIEIFKIKPRKAMTAVYLGDQYVTKFLASLFVGRHFRVADGWITADSYIIDLWKSNALTGEAINQMMAMNRKYWHRRRLEKLEILDLQKELENIEMHLEKRRRIAKIYEEKLVENGFAGFPPKKGSMPSYMKYPVIFYDEKQRSEYITKITQHGFRVDCIYRPLHEHPIFSNSNTNNNTTFEGSKYVAKRLLPLPVDPYIDDERIHNLIEILKLKTNA
jgi:dTDP-4-amino-4,6-dideoxygalactose transaminase